MFVVWCCCCNNFYAYIGEEKRDGWMKRRILLKLSFNYDFQSCVFMFMRWRARPCVRCVSHFILFYIDGANGTDDGKSLFVTYGKISTEMEIHQMKWHKIFMSHSLNINDLFLLLAATAVNTFHRLTIWIAINHTSSSDSFSLH